MKDGGVRDADCKTFSRWADNVYVQRKEQARLFQVDRKRMGGNRMAEKQKLIDLIATTKYGREGNSVLGANFQPGFIQKIADNLIANGVTFATDTNVGSKWISVKDRLPDEGEVVMCYHKAFEYPVVCQWDESDLCWVNNDWTFGRGLITHWMPLPDSPKEG